MTREEAIEVIKKEYACVDADCDIERSCGKCELHMPSKEPILKAYEMAISALERDLPKQPDTCPIYDGVCGYPIEFCSECPRHTKQEPRDDATLKDIFCMGCEYKEQEPCEDLEREYEKAKALFNKIVKDEDAISRADAIRIASGFCHWSNIPKELKKLPSVTPSRKNGHWIDMDEGFSPYECSECKLVEFKKSKYCPNCGAEMESEE